jgi:succinyl-CoA synthetase beta subunit
MTDLEHRITVEQHVIEVERRDRAEGRWETILKAKITADERGEIDAVVDAVRRRRDVAEARKRLAAIDDERAHLESLLAKEGHDAPTD